MKPIAAALSLIAAVLFAAPASAQGPATRAVGSHAVG
jgi:hypothetical protein